jgi:P27 family predicted phage terminase small subunit
MVAGAARPAALKLANGRGPGVDSGGRKVAPDLGWERLPPAPPEWLKDAARDCWVETVAELQRLRITKEIDHPSLLAYCLAYDRLIQATQMLEDEGFLNFTSQGKSAHPAEGIVERASKTLLAFAREFGLTPSAEQRVAAARDGAGTDGNPFD